MSVLNGGTLQNNFVIRWNRHPEFAVFGIPPAFYQQVVDDSAVPVVIHYSTGVGENGDVNAFGWKAVSDASWLTITSATTGSGNTTIQCSLAANNTGVSRTAHITLAGEILTFTQDASKKPRGQITSQ